MRDETIDDLLAVETVTDALERIEQALLRIERLAIGQQVIVPATFATDATRNSGQ
jgi:hypothetical protein